MTWDFDLAASILIATYIAVIARQVLVRGPAMSTLFLVGGGAMVAFGVITPQQALNSIDFSVIIFLFSMFVFAVALERAGILDHIAGWLLTLGKDPANIPFYLFIGFGLVSAFLVNDAFILLCVPMLIALAKKAKVSPVPLLLTIAYAVTVGSVMTPLGNPQNALVALSSGITNPFTVFAEYLVLPTIANLLVCGLIVRYWFGKQLAGARDDAERLGEGRVHPLIPEEPPGGWLKFIRSYPSVVLFPGTVAFLIIDDVAASFWNGVSFPLWAVSLAGALLLLLLQPAGRDILSDVNWDTLLLFVGLFVVMGGILAGGLFDSIGRLIPIPTATSGGSPLVPLGAVTLSSLFGSQVLSNVPWTALSIPFLKGLGYGAGNPPVWMALAATSTLAGNLTLLGAASNLILVTQAERAGVKITFTNFVKYGAPLTLVTVTVVFTFLVVGL